MFRDDKRQLSKSTSGSTDLPITRTESAFDITCYRCGRTEEAREIEIELPKSLGQPDVVWTRVPDGWWLQGSVMLKITAGCPGCMATPVQVHVPAVAGTAECDECGAQRTPGSRCEACGAPDFNLPGH